jgi:hypothetical protein
MRVYRVRSDVENYRWYIPNVPDHKTLEYIFDGSRRGSAWDSPKSYCFDPMKKAGDFAKFGTGSLLVSDLAKRSLLDLLELAGELLPLETDDGLFWILNVLECWNVLDEQKSRCSSAGLIEAYVFQRDRMSEATLFKIPQTRSIEVLGKEVDGNPDHEFRARVETAQMSGLIFEDLWSCQES